MTNRSTPAGKARPILAIETGSRSCSVAVYRGASEAPMFEFEHTDHGHATMLMPMIERVRAKAGCGYADFERIAVAVGPGSFTGIRVGLAAALGLSLASGLPVVGISSFLTVADIDPRERQDLPVFVVLDSRREEPFLAEVDADLAFVRPPAVVTLEELDAILASARPLILAGDAPAIDRYRLQDGVRQLQRSPNAVSVAQLAADPGRRYDLPAKPVYLRAPDVTLPKAPPVSPS